MAATCSLEAPPWPVMACLFRNRAAFAQCGCNGDALCPTQFQHTLDVLTEKGGFECHFVRAVLVNECANPVKNMPQFGIWIRDTVQIDDSQHNTVHGFAAYLNDTVSSHVGARVYTQNCFRLFSWHG